jgi:CubicO group peptidase (beta-lactamase class C family)
VQPLYGLGVSGSGRTIGIMTLASFTPNDAFAYWSALGLSVNRNRIRIVNVDGGPGSFVPDLILFCVLFGRHSLPFAMLLMPGTDYTRCLSFGVKRLMLELRHLALAIAGIGVENLNALLETILRKYNLPALAGATVTSEGLSAVGAVGVRKYGSNIRTTVDDQFHLGSDTKAMTATMLATLVEDGKLSWSTTLEQVFPELAPGMNPAYTKVTLEHLLAHRAGFTGASWPLGNDFADMYRLPGMPREQRLAYVAMVLREPPVSEPGTKFLYSNRSYAVAGAMGEKAANDSWENLMQKRLFQPLDMQSCGFGPMGDPRKIDQPWQHKLLCKSHRPIKPRPHADNPPVIGPAATVHCSVIDWAKFVIAHLRGEQGMPGLLRPETFRRLHTPPLGGEYACGWLVTERSWAGGRALSHAGSNTQNYAVVWMALAKDFAVLVVTNQAGGRTFNACNEAASALIAHVARSK